MKESTKKRMVQLERPSTLRRFARWIRYGAGNIRFQQISFCQKQLRINQKQTVMDL